jgi:hypothetical protein
MKTTAGTGEIMISSAMRAVGKFGTCVPYDGTDIVFTFRHSNLRIPTRFVRIPNLRETFDWLTSVSPWNEDLEQFRAGCSDGSVVLLLSEYGWHPIWEKNRNWEPVHIELARAVLDRTGCRNLIIKPHPRSDGTAAIKLFNACRDSLPGIAVRIMPSALSTLPIEALSIALNLTAACSIGSCSLPSDLGFGTTHYTSTRLAAVFDAGWTGQPFWLKYENAAAMLISEDICVDVETPSSS